jgi:hypothetical protein
MSAGRLVLASLLTAALFAAVGVVMAYRAWHATEQVEQVIASPDSTRLAHVVSVRESGRTGRQYTVVRVGRSGTHDSAATSVAARTASSGDSGTVWIENARAVSVQWTAPRQLAVQYTGPAVVEGKVPRVGDVHVTYLATDSIRTLPMAPAAKPAAAKPAIVKPAALKPAPKPATPPHAHDSAHATAKRRAHHAAP